MTTLISAVLAMVVGAVLGLLGGGGSILALPILAYVVGIEPKAAIATSLLVVGATSVAALIAHARAGNVVWRIAAIFAPAAMAGAYLGGVVAHWVPAKVLLLGFAAMMVIAAVSMWRGRSESDARQPIATHWLVLEALVVGFVTGMVGAGGGFMVVPVLFFFVGLSIKESIGTSLVIIAAKSFAGFAGFVGHVSIEVPVAAAFVAFAVLGSLLGGMWSQKVDAAKLRRGFAILVVVIAIAIVGKELDFGLITHIPPIAWLAIALGLAVNLLGLHRIRANAV